MTEEKVIENREYKSDVFSMLMQEPKYALDVYNTLNGSKYDNPDLVEMKTLDKCISLTMRNDAAFIIDMNLSIYEHQSTYNPNMPLRALLYLSDILKPNVKNRLIYSKTKIEIPTPRFVVFYNGKEERPAKETQRLSDSYKHKGDISLELICTVININSGYNEDIRKQSAVLDGYTTFVEKVRDNIENKDKEPVINAIEYCISNGILAEFFSTRKEEVVKSMTIDMTFERQLELSAIESKEEGKAEGLQEGLQQGLKQGRILLLVETINKKIAKNKTLEQIADDMEEDIDFIKPIYDVIIENKDKSAEEILGILQGK